MTKFAQQTPSSLNAPLELPTAQPSILARLQAAPLRDHSNTLTEIRGNSADLNQFIQTAIEKKDYSSILGKLANLVNRNADKLDGIGIYDQLNRSMDSGAAAFLAMVTYDRPKIAQLLTSDMTAEGMAQAKEFNSLMNGLKEIVGTRANLGPPTSMAYAERLQNLNDYLQLLTPPGSLNA